MKISNFKFQISKGQSLFELVMAIGISALVIVVLVSLVTNALQNAVLSRNETLATRLAESATEWLRGQRDDNITTFITNAVTAPASWCLKDASLTDTSWNEHSPCGTNDVVTSTIFKRQVDFVHTTTPSATGNKDVYTATVTVKWTDSKQTHIVNSSTNLTDWRQR